MRTFSRPTPAWTQALLNQVKFDGVISEPCAGDGAVVRVLEANGYEVDASDLVDHGAGFRIENTYRIEHHVNVATNPPYSVAESLIKHWLRTTERKVAVLVRLGFLEGQRRYDQIFCECPPAMVVVIRSECRCPASRASHSITLGPYGSAA